MMGDEAALWTGERIGLIGGTFDPPHSGHLSMAREARRALGLDRVLFSVAPRPPHKLTDPTSPLEHRVRMVEIAIEHEDGVGITHMEEAHETSYTVELLRACRMRTRADLYFIMGADSLSELSTWKEPEEILRLASLVVFPRDRVAMRLDVPGPAALVMFESPRIDVSSTAVRESIASGRDVNGSLPTGVAAYARTHGLYRAG
ncbi:MAG TPA: nicotinate-nucleotide adenylyltransferase [Candidatus Krumholzibacteria bacterium]|nr:nicotinate-nucleotide adenylyltransferase [Candidatus Krumholzibacteria bacterium]